MKYQSQNSIYHHDQNVIIDIRGFYWEKISLFEVILRHKNNFFKNWGNDYNLRDYIGDIHTYIYMRER